MAGAILIGENTGVSMSTQAFHDIVDRIRGQTRSEDADIVARIYHTLDVGHLPTICTWELDERGFNVFTHAVMCAYAKAKDEGNGQARFGGIWEELIREIKSDPRYSPAAAGFRGEVRRAG